MGFSIRQFSEVFKIRDPAGQPYILIGSQVVNYWAERYLSKEPELKAIAQSKDEKIRRFKEQQLEQGHKRSGGISS